MTSPLRYNEASLVRLYELKNVVVVNETGLIIQRQSRTKGNARQVAAAPPTKKNQRASQPQ